MITNIGLSYLQNCHTVIFSGFSQKFNITGDNLKYLKNCHTIVFPVSDIIDEDLIHIKNCINIDLSSCQKITQNAVKIFEKFHFIKFGCFCCSRPTWVLPKKRTIEYCYCNFFTNEMLNNFKNLGIEMVRSYMCDID